jgi:succinate dehydrogenase / fumarate reductase iron-sulfur subunit
MKVKLKVRRTNGESGEAAFSKYEIETANNATVLDALIQVREYEDGTLGLRCSCRAAICGSCSMRVDGQSRLACRAKVVGITRGNEDHEIVVEPMGNMPVIKDLVSDMESFWSKVRQIEPYLQPEHAPPEGQEYRVPNEAMLDLTHTMNCIMCGACVSACTVLEVDKSFIAPAALAKAYRFAGDPRDDHTHDRLEYLSTAKGGIWDCTRCNMCVEVCPKGVAPMDRIMQLREMAVEAGVPGGTGARHGHAFAQNIRKNGRLDEARLLPDSVGLFNVPRLLSEIPGGIRMLRAGKLPWSHALPWHKPIPGIKSVRRIFDNIRSEKKGKAPK